APKAKKAKAKVEEEEEEEEAPKAKKAKTEGTETGEEDLCVFVGGLPFSTSEEQIKKDFEECGEISRFVLPKNDEGRPKGIAFITYASKAGVDAALKFNGDDYGGRTLKVNLASDKSDKGKGKGKDKGKGKGKDGKGKGKEDRNDELTVMIKGLSWSLSRETVEKDFAECGEIVRCSAPTDEEGNLKGFAFIEYKDEEAVKKALEFNETEYSSRRIYVNKANEGGKGKDGKGKGKDGKGKKGKDKGKGKGKKGMSAEGKAAKHGNMVESTGKKQTFDSDEEEASPPKKKAKVAKPADDEDDE
ncbi:unnamed protein product, partial [Effrenium voratum]